ncbi:MAG TPA: NAD(P)H-dependent oxidoreductase subunit E [Candidatus Dormibacteraeota bacterium]|nr:NAD(P)H-dependent oxidoreductase subunit E [Candidatus Dormibacteraeota bacterium]
MSEAPSASGSDTWVLNAVTRERIRRSRALYPWPRSAVLPALWAVQDQLGFLPPEGLVEVAAELGLQPAEVEAVSTFYSMYFQQQPGRHLIQVCRNVSCGLRGADQLLADLENLLQVSDGQTTEDGVFTLEGTVECLGACGGAPMMQVDRLSYEDLDLEGARQVLAQIRAASSSAPGANPDA